MPILNESQEQSSNLCQKRDCLIKTSFFEKYNQIFTRHARKSAFSTLFQSQNQVYDELDHGFALFGFTFGDEQCECDESAIAQDFGAIHAIEDFVAGHVPQENECGDAFVAIDKGMVLDE